MSPVPAKVLHLLALTGKEEATYGGGATLTASLDGLQMQFDKDDQDVVFSPKYLSDGDLGPSILSLGTMQRVSPTGLYYEGTIPSLLRLPLSAYSATVLPNLHRLIKMCGFDATVTTSAGSEKWVYTPTPGGTGYTSLALNGYERGEVASLLGALGNLKIDGKNSKPPIFSFETKAFGSTPADSSPIIPTGITYPNQAIMPLVNQGISFVLGSFAAGIIKNWSFDEGRKYGDTPRLNLAAANPHAGYVPSGRAPMLTVDIEQTALVANPFHSTAGFDPYKLWDQAIPLGVVSVGLNQATQYNRFKLALNQAQVVNAVRKGEGATAIVTLTIAGHCSTPESNDDLTLTCD